MRPDGRRRRAGVLAEKAVPGHRSPNVGYNFFPMPDLVPVPATLHLPGGSEWLLLSILGAVSVGFIWLLWYFLRGGKGEE